MGRIIGLDIGDKRIGVAISDPLGITAQPFGTVYRKEGEAHLLELKKMIEEHSADKIIVGVPLDLRGEMGKAAGKVLEFAERLKAATGAEVEIFDERFTTQLSERLLVEAGVSRRKRKEINDKIAAACILQGYLDRHNLERKTAIERKSAE